MRQRIHYSHGFRVNEVCPNVEARCLLRYENVQWYPWQGSQPRRSLEKKKSRRVTYLYRTVSKLRRCRVAFLLLRSCRWGFTTGINSLVLIRVSSNVVDSPRPQTGSLRVHSRSKYGWRSKCRRALRLMSPQSRTVREMGLRIWRGLQFRVWVSCR